MAWQVVTKYGEEECSCVRKKGTDSLCKGVREVLGTVMLRRDQNVRQ